MISSAGHPAEEPWHVVLNVRQDASPADIKLAYFTALRAYDLEMISVLHTGMREAANSDIQKIVAAYKTARVEMQAVAWGSAVSKQLSQLRDRMKATRKTLAVEAEAERSQPITTDAPARWTVHLWLKASSLIWR